LREPLLILNAGSSSIKFSVFETAEDRSVSAGAHGQVSAIGGKAQLEVSEAAGAELARHPVAARDHLGAIGAIHDWFAAHIGGETGFAGVGHRLVHGGRDYVQPVLVDADVLAGIEALTPLAPLHQPHEIAAIRAIARFAPHVAQVACFDTAFHAAQSDVVRRYALPRTLSDAGVLRYGFHGLSYEYIVSRLPEIMPECAGGKIVVAHLGNGSSLCAIENGRSVATTMGFTALDGVPMGTRCGALDPGAILYLLQHERMDANAIEQMLYQKSGLLGMSGISSDMRELLASDAPAAAQAVDVLIHRIGREIGSLAAALGGLDALVFTGGIGEHAVPVRARVCIGASWLGVTLDAQANAAGGPRISTAGAKVSAWVIPTDENLMIARHTRRLLDRNTA
jgi:acetate kinase